MKLSFGSNIKAVAAAVALVLPTTTHAMPKIPPLKLPLPAKVDTATLSGKMYFLSPAEPRMYMFSSKETPISTSVLTVIDGAAHGIQKDLGVFNDYYKLYTENDTNYTKILGKAFREADSGKAPSDTSSGMIRRLMGKIADKNIYIQKLNGEPVDCIRINTALDTADTYGYNLVPRDALGADSTIKQGATRYYFSNCRDVKGNEVNVYGQKIIQE